MVPTWTFTIRYKKNIGTLGKSTSMAAHEDIVEDGQRQPVLQYKR